MEDQAVEAKDAGKQRKISPAEQRKQQQYLERRNRLINEGVDPKKVDNVIAAEDYEALPLDKKFKRLEKLVMDFSRSIISDVNALRHNDNVLSNVYDENLRTSERLFAKLGITPEDFLKALAEAREESAEARAKEDMAKNAQAAVQSAQDAVATVADEPGEPLPPPEEATSFSS